MTTLAEATLELAKIMNPVYEGTATSGSLVYIADMNMPIQQGEFDGGTLWMTSGSSSGLSGVVKSHAQNKLTLSAAMSGSVIDTGDDYAVADDTFPRYMLVQAIKNVLRMTDIPEIDTTHTATDGECTLTGISNVRRVLVDGDINYYWKEVDGKIIFDDEDTEGDLTIYYLKHANTVTSDTDTIDPAVSLDYLLWSAAVYLWRWRLQQIKKDDPTAAEMAAEALRNQQLSELKARTYAMVVMPRDPHLANGDI